MIDMSCHERYAVSELVESRIEPGELQHLGKADELREPLAQGGLVAKHTGERDYVELGLIDVKDED